MQNTNKNKFLYKNKFLQKKNVLTTVGIIVFEIILFCIATLAVTPFYETDDDSTMAAITMGIYGERSYHLVFMHSILGRIIVFLTNLLPIVNWYSILQWSLLFCSFTVILSVLVKDTSFLRTILIVVLLGATFNFHSFFSLQFTRTAATIALAGVLLLTDTLEQKENGKIWQLMLGAVLLILGSMNRFEGYGMTLCMAFLWVAVFFLRHIKAKEWSIVKRYLLWFGVPIVLSIGLYVSDLAMYEQDKAWKEYKNYNNFRGELLDHGFPSMEENEELYESLGIGETEFFNYTLWDFADTEKFTAEAMQQLVEARAEDRMLKNIRIFFSETYLAVKKFPFIWFIPIAILYFFLFKKQRMLEFLAIAAGFIGVEMYFICLGRAQLEYTNAAMWLTIMVLVCYSSKDKKFLIDKKLIKYICCLAGCICAAAMWYRSFTIVIDRRYQKNVNPDRNEVTKLISEDKENFYISKVGHGALIFYDIWRPFKEGEMSNMSTLGDWMTMSPIVVEQLEKYDIYNPYRALGEKDNTYLIDAISSDWKQRYIAENYNPDAKAVLEKQIGGYKIWKFVDEELALETENYINIEANEEFHYDGTITEGAVGLYFDGYLYEEGTNSYHQKMYLGVTREGMPEEFYYVPQTRNTQSNDLYHGKYGGYSVYYEGKLDFEKDKVSFYLENETGLYQVRFTESM